VTIGLERRRSRKCRAEEQSWNAAATQTDVGTEMMTLAPHHYYYYYYYYYYEKLSLYICLWGSDCVRHIANSYLDSDIIYIHPAYTAYFQCAVSEYMFLVILMISRYDAVCLCHIEKTHLAYKQQHNEMDSVWLFNCKSIPKYF